MSGESVTAALKPVRIVVFDVDGVFTDGRFWLDEDGREIKSFHTHDGYGIRCLLNAGYEVAIITGRRSGAVTSRMRELGIEKLVQGCRNKLAALQKIAKTSNLLNEQIAYVGDDIPDLEVMREAGVAIAVANAVDEIKSIATFTTQLSGGRGAVREVCDLVLAHGALSS